MWNQYVVPRLADRALRGRDVGELRRTACADLHGQVLEVGFGSGLNLRFLPTSVTGLDAVEPSDHGWSLSERRRARSPVPVVRLGLDGQRLAAADHSYDSAVVTFALCTIPDPALALAEVRRTLRPGGVLVMLEHGLSPDPAVARWQRRLDPVQRTVAGGCHLTRDPVAMAAAAGFGVAVREQSYLPGPGFSHPWTWVTSMTARARGA